MMERLESNKWMINPFIKTRYKIKDYTGIRMSFVEFLRPVNKKNSSGSYFWECKCHLCGKEKFLRVYSQLVRSSKKTDVYSCGCTNKNITSPNYRGYKDLPATYFNRVKKGAVRRDYKFEISIEYCYNLFIQQDKKCKLSGLSLTLPYLDKPIKGRTHLSTDHTASLDRIDSSKGYIESNVQWVHKRVNIMKMHLSDQEFIEWCTLIAEHNKQKP